MTLEDQDWFNNKPLSTVASDLEVAMEEVNERQVWDNAQRMDTDQLKDMPQNPVDMPPQATREASMLPPEE